MIIIRYTDPKAARYKQNIGVIPNFCWLKNVKEMENGNRIRFIEDTHFENSYFRECREEMADIINDLVNGCDASSELTRTRLLLAVGEKKAFGEDSGLSKEQIKKLVFTGKRVINLMENYAKMSRRSVIVTVKGDRLEINDSAVLCMITGPKEWVRIPQLLSLFLLILRMSIIGCYIRNVDGVDISSLDGALSHLDDIYKYTSEELRNRGELKLPLSSITYRFDKDRTYYKEIRRFIKPILRNYKKLFNMPIKELYPADDKDGFLGHGGISTLVKCATGNKNLNAKFKSLILDK